MKGGTMGTITVYPRFFIHLLIFLVIVISISVIYLNNLSNKYGYACLGITHPYKSCLECRGIQFNGNLKYSHPVKEKDC